MTREFLRIEHARGVLMVPADQVRLQHLQVSEDGTRWDYTLRIVASDPYRQEADQ